ncbi:MAG: endonuclease/exonuclease/phosphatase family protein [Verrucomicrobiales bacterium]|nr:endonuclease/exonuclease/phosphatase family protein [Verrucomicrobiales bacterium]
MPITSRASRAPAARSADGMLATNRWKRGLHRLAASRLPWALLILTWICLLVRLTVRDAHDWSALFFYIGPWPILLVSWPLLALPAFLNRRGLRLRLGLAGLGLLVTFAGWKFSPAPPPLAPIPPGSVAGPARTVLFWNINHPRQVPAQVHELLQRHRPDILVLAEAEKQSPEDLAAMRVRHPDYHISRLPGGILLAVLGRAQLQKTIHLPSRTNALWLHCQFTDNPAEHWQLILADLGPWPLLPRTDRTEAVRQFAGSAPRTLVIGDFNTPYDSTAFDPWRHAWNHGLSQSPGSPGNATWPLGLPLLSIDHIWMSPDLRPLRAQKGTPGFYDHAWQLITVGL